VFISPQVDAGYPLPIAQTWLGCPGGSTESELSYMSRELDEEDQQFEDGSAGSAAGTAAVTAACHVTGTMIFATLVMRLAA